MLQKKGSSLQPSPSSTSRPFPCGGLAALQVFLNILMKYLAATLVLMQSEVLAHQMLLTSLHENL
jgi:hypothetical protein